MEETLFDKGILEKLIREGKNLAFYTAVDALSTPWRIQMWVQVEHNGRGRSLGTLPSS